MTGPDDIYIIPWVQGRCLIWDATCHDTFALTNILFSCNGAGIVADRAGANKQIIYYFVPIAVESSGPGKTPLIFFMISADVPDKLKSKDPQSYLKLCQKISVKIQHLNSVSVLGCSSIS